MSELDFVFVFSTSQHQNPTTSLTSRKMFTFVGDECLYTMCVCLWVCVCVSVESFQSVMDVDRMVGLGAVLIRFPCCLLPCLKGCRIRGQT